MTAVHLQRRPKLLMVCHRVPHPLDRGDRIRTWNLLTSLSPHFDIFLAAVAHEPLAFDSWRALREHVADLVIEPICRFGRHRAAVGAILSGNAISERAFLSVALKRHIDRWTMDYQFDAALGVCSSTAAYLRDLDIHLTVMDLMDVDSQKWADYAETATTPMRTIYRRESQRLAELERRICHEFDAVTVVTEREARMLRQITGAANVFVTPCGVDHSPNIAIESAREPIVAFTGSLNYRPNVDGIVWFANHVWPAVIDRMPESRLHIIGRRPTRAVRRLAQRAGICVFADVPDVRPYLQQAAIAIAPLRIARGVQLKALEAMAMGRAVIASSHVAGGIGATIGQEIAVADDAPQWAEAITGLLRDPMRRQALGAAARRFIETFHRWDACVEPLIQTLLGRSPHIVVTPQRAPRTPTTQPELSPVAASRLPVRAA